MTVNWRHLAQARRYDVAFMEEAGFEYDEQSEQSFKNQVEHFYEYWNKPKEEQQCLL
jgi:hypothetical protein